MHGEGTLRFAMWGTVLAHFLLLVRESVLLLWFFKPGQYSYIEFTCFVVESLHTYNRLNQILNLTEIRKSTLQYSIIKCLLKF